MYRNGSGERGATRETSIYSKKQKKRDGKKRKKGGEEGRKGRRGQERIGREKSPL